MPLKAAINAAGGLASTLLTNHAQRKENEKSREYNLKLAQMQNQMNVEQWQRENDYNSPTAQLQRLKDAGLNPDMMYGGSGISNTAASSPSMTAGAPASPANLVGMPNSVSDYLDAQLKQQQIDALEKDNKEKDIKLKYEDARQLLGMNLTQQEYEKNQLLIQDLQDKLKSNKVNLDIQSADYLLKQVEYAYRAQAADANLKILQNNLKLSDNEVQHMVEAKVLELANKSLDNKQKEAQLKWDDPSILENLGVDGAAALLKILLMIFK